MIERRFRAGDTLTEQGSSGVGFFVIEEGTAEVTVDGEAKGTLGPGDYFGEVALLSGGTRIRTATITATTDMLTYGMTAWEFKPLVESQFRSRVEAAHGDGRQARLASLQRLTTRSAKFAELLPNSHQPSTSGRTNAVLRP